MITTQTKIIPQKQIIEEQFTCDLCGVKLKAEYTSVNSDEVRIMSWKDIDNGSLQQCSIDCCIGCFESKIKPMIEVTFNVKFRISNL